MLNNTKKTTEDPSKKEYYLNLRTEKFRYVELFDNNWKFKLTKSKITTNICQLLKDLERADDNNNGVKLTIKKETVPFPSFYEGKGVENFQAHINNISKILKGFLKNNPNALNQFKESLKTIIIDQKQQTTALINEKLIKNFLSAQKIDIKEKIEEVRKIIKNDFPNNLFNTQNEKNKKEKKENDRLFTYVVFLENITGKNIKTLLNFIKNYEQVMLDAPLSYLINPIIKPFDKYIVTNSDLQQNIIIGENMITVEGKVNQWKETSTNEVKKPNNKEGILKYQYEQKDGEKKLNLIESYIISKDLKNMMLAAPNVAPLIDPYKKIQSTLGKSFSQYNKHQSKKHPLIKWLLKSPLTKIKENNIKIIQKTRGYIKTHITTKIEKALDNISQKENYDIDQTIRTEISKLRGKCRDIVDFQLDKIEYLKNKIKKYQRVSFLAKIFNKKKSKNNIANELLKKLENSDPENYVGLLKIINDALIKSKKADYKKHKNKWQNRDSKFWKILTDYKSLLFKNCPKKELNNLIQQEIKYLKLTKKTARNHFDTNNTDLDFSYVDSKLKDYQDKLQTTSTRKILNDTNKPHNIATLKSKTHKNVNERKKFTKNITKLFVFFKNLTKPQNPNTKISLTVTKNTVK